MQTGEFCTIMFDMGGVVLDFDPLIPCRILAPIIGLDPAEILKRVMDTDAPRLFELGSLSEEQFTDQCNKALGTNIKQAELQKIWSNIFTENEAVSNIIRAMKPKAQLILLSNTNIWHFTHAKRTYRILDEFDTCVPSYQIGLMKPDRRIYQVALRFARHPERVLFVDDIAENVDAAQQLGIRAIQYTGAEQLDRTLQRAACL